MCVYRTDDGKCKKFSDDKIISYCVDAPCEFEKPSNYDRIKNMSVDEMASFICGIYDEEDYDVGSKFICGFVIPYYDEESVKQWLESEVE